MTPRRLVVGLGCSLACPPEELLALVHATLAEAGPGTVHALATVDRRAHEPAMLHVAARLRRPLRTHPAAALRTIPVPTPSAVVAAHVGTPSVAEAAALLTAGTDRLLVAKRRRAHATCAIAEVPA